MKKLIFVIIWLNILSISCDNDENVDIVKNTPNINTKDITNIRLNSATSGGSITNNGGDAISTSGICWSTSPNPTISLVTKTTDGNTSDFSSSLTSLNANTTYYVKAYATNSVGTAYGDEIIFTTSLSSIPMLSTNEVSNISGTNATSGGIILNDGGADITVSGICWSTSSNPTTSLNTKTIDGNANSFSSNLTGLTAGNTYYVRAYATNNVGTAYGNEVSFIAKENYFTSFDNTILSKMNQYNVPSISIAIIRNEKLVYLKAYGKSDLESNKTANNEDLYRIASVSKPITAIAILKMVQNGQINLDQKIFGTGSILGNDFGPVPAGSNKDLITVRHLIDHKSGWTNVPDDPMFRSNTITQSQLISDLVASRALSTNPGSTYYYLNFGYCILGRVIEKVSGSSYENYVKNNVLSECNISTMMIGGSTLNQRKPNEVKYYQSEFSPYVMNIPRFDSHGGWIASSKDLAKFMVRIDRNTSRSDIISTNLLNQFYFGFTNWTHYGSIPGTSSILSRMNNNLSFVMLANTRTNNDGSIILNDLNNTIQAQINAITNWPTEDLF